MNLGALLNQRSNPSGKYLVLWSLSCLVQVALHSVWPLWSSRLDMVLKPPSSLWLLSTPDFKHWNESYVKPTPQSSLEDQPPACHRGRNFRSCPFPGHWILIQILWVSESCLSLEFLISSSSFSDLVLISFCSAFSLENVCSIQASAYSLLLNTQVNIHWISVALFSSSCNKLSCLLLEATMSPYWTPGFACACKIPLNLSSSPVPPHLDCFL